MMKTLFQSNIRFIIVIMLLFLGLFTGCIDDTNNVNEIRVHQDGTGDFVSIQAAIDACAENETIRIYEGIYVENLVINKSVTLIGNHVDTTIIDGDLIGNVITVNADNVQIYNLTLQNSGTVHVRPHYYAGIHMNSISNTIINCKILNNANGIFLNSTTNNNEFYSNSISDNQNGIYSNVSSENSFKNNSFKNCISYGIYLYGSSNDNLIEDNFFSECGTATRIKGRSNMVARNIFMNNSRGLYICCGAVYNTVYHNSFLNNSNYHGRGNYNDNSWYKDPPIGGNFWDDYDEKDSNGDGFGDIVYVVDERDDFGSLERIRDKYPLMEPKVMP